MRLGTIGLWGDDLERFRDQVRLAEELGFEVFGVGDSPSAWHEMVVSLTVVAYESSSIVVTPMVTTPYLRHPSTVASALSALHELSGGRVACAIGSGGSALGSLGRRKGATNADMRAFVSAVRDLLHGEQAEFDGYTTAKLTRGRPLPVLMGADGPKALRLAGEIADGAVIGVGMSLDVIDGKIAGIRAGAEAAGRDPDALDIWGNAFLAVRDTRDEANADILPLLASTAGMGMKAPHSRALVPPDLLARFEEMERRYDPSVHTVPGSANVQLLEELGLVDFMVGVRGITGNGSEVATHLKELEARGISTVLVPMPGHPDPEGNLRRVSAAMRGS